MAEGLLDKANIILTPTGYKAGTMYNVAPIEQPYEDFVFSRASVDRPASNPTRSRSASTKSTLLGF